MFSLYTSGCSVVAFLVIARGHALTIEIKEFCKAVYYLISNTQLRVHYREQGGRRNTKNLRKILSCFCLFLSPSLTFQKNDHYLEYNPIFSAGRAGRLNGGCCINCETS